MKTRTGLSIGLALTLMVGVFATMLALGLFTTVDVQAAKGSDPATMVTGTAGTDSDQPGLSVTSEFIDTLTEAAVTFTTSTDGALAVSDTITVEFPGNVYVPSFIDNTGTKQANAVTVAVDGAAAVPATKVATSGQKVTVTTPAAVPISTEVVVTFPIQTLTAPTENVGDMVGIRTPHVDGSSAITVKVSTSEDRGAVTSAPSANDFDLNSADLGATGRSDVFGVTVDHTPGGTNDNARITVDFYSPLPLTANLDTITIEFADDVQVPAVLDERFVSVVGNFDAEKRHGRQSSGRDRGICWHSSRRTQDHADRW